MHLSSSQQIYIKNWGKTWPEFKKIMLLGEKSYKVPTYYIIIHGLKYNEVPTLGFPEWT